MNPVDSIVLGVIVVCLFLAIRAVHRRRMHGGGCCGSCSGCSAAGTCKMKSCKSLCPEEEFPGKTEEVREE